MNKCLKNQLIVVEELKPSGGGVGTPKSPSVLISQYSRNRLPFDKKKYSSAVYIYKALNIFNCFIPVPTPIRIPITK